MANKDQVTKINPDATIESGVTIVDTQGYESLTFILPVQDTTALSLEHGDDSALADAVAVPADFVLGETAYTAAGTGKVGYVGKKRYVRITVTDAPADDTIVAVLGTPHEAPV